MKDGGVQKRGGNYEAKATSSRSTCSHKALMCCVWLKFAHDSIQVKSEFQWLLVRIK